VSEMVPKAHSHGTVGELDPRPTDHDLPVVAERARYKTMEVLAVNGHKVLDCCAACLRLRLPKERTHVQACLKSTRKNNGLITLFQSSYIAPDHFPR
jgi:hypothetical protein